MALLLLSDIVHLNPSPIDAQPALRPDLIVSVDFHATPADGHCFMHTVQQSLSSYLNCVYISNDVLNGIKQELANNEAAYATFFTSSMSCLHSEAVEYLIANIILLTLVILYY